MKAPSRKFWNVSILIVFLLVPSLVFTQNAQGEKYKNSSALLLDGVGNLLNKGKIYELKDSSIVMLNTINRTESKTEFAVTNIETIIIKERKGPKGFLIGAGIGSVLGALISATYVEVNKSFKPGLAFAPVMIGFGFGGLIGGISSNQGKSISLYRHQKAYEMEKDRLRDYSFL